MPQTTPLARVLTALGLVAAAAVFATGAVTPAHAQAAEPKVLNIYLDNRKTG